MVSLSVLFWIGLGPFLWQSQLLMDRMNQRILRSMLICFKRIRLEQARYIDVCGDIDDCLRMYLVWADATEWAKGMLAPALADALLTDGHWSSLFFKYSVPAAAAPLLGDSGTGSEDAQFLFLHVRLAMGMLKHCIAYALQPQSVPWVFALLLGENYGRISTVLASLRSTWELILKLEASPNPVHKDIVKRLPLLQWVVLREPMMLLENAGWRLDNSWGELALKYTRAMFKGISNTMGLENDFNVLRDNEAREARHTVRGDGTLQALAISSLNSRYEGQVPLVSVEAEDVGEARSFHCRPSFFRASDAPTSKQTLGVDPWGLVNDRAAWPSTKSDVFNDTQSPLLKAVERAPEDAWGNLWMCRLLKEHMLITEAKSGKLFYVLGVAKWTASLLELVSERPGEATVVADPRLFHPTVLATSLNQYSCHSYNLFCRFERSAVQVGCTVLATASMLEYCCSNFLHLLRVETLKDILDDGHVDYQRSASQLDLASKVLEHAGSSDAVVENMLERIQALMAKRARKKKPSGSPGCGGQEEPEGGEAEEEDPDEAAEPVAVPPILQQLAEGEVNFLLGKGGADKALNEEEQDVGLDFLAKVAGKDEGTDQMPAKRRRSGPQPKESSAPSSSSGAEAAAVGSMYIGGSGGGSAPSSSSVAEEAAALGSAGEGGEGPEPADFSGLPPHREPGGLRMPRADDMVPPDPRCALRKYVPADAAPYWIAILPGGSAYLGKKSKSRCFHTPAQEVLAKQSCYAWLVQAVRANALG